MNKLRFGKEWKEDILGLSKEHMFILFKSLCIRLVILEKDFKEAKTKIEEYEKNCKNISI